MFFIVLFHIIIHGKTLDNCQNEGVKIILEILVFITLVHVNSFVMATGFFQVNSKFKQKKLWSLINASWFYRVVIMSILLLMNIIHLDKLAIIKEVFPLNITEYWFLQDYLLLYCLSPFINKLINSIDKGFYKKLLLVLFIILSLIPTMTGGQFFNNNGLTLYQFIYMYILGAYFRKYPLNRSYIFKRMSMNLYKITLIIIFIFCVFLNFIIYNYAEIFTNINTITAEISKYINNAAFAYSNPIVIVQTIVFFSYFSTITIKSKVINKIAGLTFGVYLIHDNDFMRNSLYKWLSINNGVKYYSYKFILYLIVVAVLIYIVCSIIELIRKAIFSFIYKRKISQKIIKGYYNYINKIYILNHNMEDV